MGGSNGTMRGSTGTELVLVGADNGVAVVSSDTPLRRLNYFDGKFLRAEHMRAEQEYLCFLVRTSNRAGGSGIVNGFDTVLAGGGASVTVGPGLALDAQGRVLLLSGAKTLKLDDIIVASNAVAPGSIATAGSADFADCVVTSAPTLTTSGQTADLYLLTVGFLEALCGEEDVFGKLCEAACVQSKDRPWRMEGVLFRAVPLLLKTLLQVSKSVPVRDNQLRSRVASAYFADERAAIASLISGVNIKGSDVWCLGAAAEIGNAVPLAVFSRSGGQTHFLDAWTARREHIETPARRYWAWRFSMRPWDVFLAQVLQYQCQLHEILSGLVDGGPGTDPCAPKTAAIGKATELLGKLETWHTNLATALTPDALTTLKLRLFDVAAISGLKSDLGKLAIPIPPSTRILIDGGILELPSAGCLPINVGGSTVNQQVRNFMGPGVDLRFCICRPDFIPHVLEEAQHMERISLLDGIDDPKRMPHVDVFVPNGETAKTIDQTSRYFDLALFEPTHFPSLFGTRVAPAVLPRPFEEGAARWAPFGDGGHQFYWAGTSRLFSETGPARTDPPAGWIEVTLDRDPFALAGPLEFASIYARFIDLAPSHVSVRLSNLRFTPDGPATPGNPGELVIKGSLAGTSVYTDRPHVGGLGVSPSISVQLRRLTNAAGGRITVEPPHPGGGPSLYWDWTAGSPLAGSLYLTKPGSDDIKLLEVKEDPDAQNPSNIFHSLSERAIPALQKQLAIAPFNDTGFATYAEQALFPPPDPKSSLDVIATLDWVLFARRRECSCPAAAPAPVPNLPRRFRVYWVDADRLPKDFSLSKDDLGSIQNLLHEVDIVTFQAGSTVLDQPKAAADHLRFQVSGNTLQGAVIAMQDPADPAPIESGRLTSYIGAVGDVVDITHPDAPVVLPRMPPALVDANVSGMILVALSTLEVKEAVYRLEPNPDLPMVIKAVTDGSMRILSLVNSGHPLGFANFAPGAATLLPNSDNLQTAWKAQGGGDVGSAFAFFAPDVTDTPAVLEQRSTIIEAAVGSTPKPPSNPKPLSQQNWDLATAKIALFLLPAPQFLKVAVYRAVVEELGSAADPIPALKLGSLTALNSGPFTLVGVYEFNQAGVLKNPNGLISDFNATRFGDPREGRAFYAGTVADGPTVAQRCQKVLDVLQARFSLTPARDTQDASVFASAPIVIVLGTLIVG